MNKRYNTLNYFSDHYWAGFYDADEPYDCECIENKILTQSVKEWNQMGFQVVHPSLSDEEGMNAIVQYMLV